MSLSSLLIFPKADEASTSWRDKVGGQQRGRETRKKVLDEMED